MCPGALATVITGPLLSCTVCGAPSGLPSSSTARTVTAGTAAVDSTPPSAVHVHKQPPTRFGVTATPPTTSMKIRNRLNRLPTTGRSQLVRKLS